MKARRVRYAIVDRTETRMNEPIIRWFHCTNCDSYYIREWFQYCPECGRRLKWSVKK